MKKYLVSIFIILISIVIGLIALPNLTDELPIHWTQGEADIFVSKFVAIFIIPFFMLVTSISIIVMDKIQNNKRNSKTINTINNISLLFMFAIQLFIISVGLEIELNSDLFMGIIIGGIITLVANPMQKTKPNALYGLRTPWTLKDERVWTKANRFAGKLLFVVGILIIGLSFVVPDSISIISILLILVTAFIAVMYSYLIYRRLNLS
ncbi:SdpI family protein [Oceanobacillus piezotolerans]|nr:SdpI family protein [Oceanobacillus piezotolerans]